MPWSVFWETLRRESRSTLFWSIGMALYGVLTTAILPDPNGMQQIVDTMESLPPFFFQMLGVEDLSILATPAGFIGLRFFLTAAVLLAVWAVLSGLNVITNDESRGIANMVISLPLSRARVLVERILAYIFPSIVIPLAGVAGLAFGMTVNPFAKTEMGPLILAGLMLTPVALVILSLTVLIGAAMPRRGMVAATAGGFVAISFMLKSVAGIARSNFGDTMAELSVFQHADAIVILRDGFPVVTALILLGLAAVMAVAAAGFFQSRDLAA